MEYDDLKKQQYAKYLYYIKALAVVSRGKSSEPSTPRNNRFSFR
jgi:hypothetical protein